MTYFEERRKQCLQLSLQRLRDSRGVSDEVERAIVAIQTEEQARDPPTAGAIADDDAVHRAVMLDLRHGLARSGLVGKVEALCDHAIEPDDLEPLEPLPRHRCILRDRREREPLRALLELDASLSEPTLVQRLAVPEQDVEHDVARRRLH